MLVLGHAEVALLGADVSAAGVVVLRLRPGLPLALLLATLGSASPEVRVFESATAVTTALGAGLFPGPATRLRPFRLGLSSLRLSHL